ncbi:MAG TPA: DUF2497 domain-containing protein [Caulobacteraceae bacterium]|nr:DUF2497 domain-containing protein [Caulobacteraceae bacterium]
MSEQTAPEPTMEEILASIRRIISEDDAPAAESAPGLAPEPEPVVAAAPEPAPEPEPGEPGEDVLELTQRVEPPAAAVGDIEAYEPERPRSVPAATIAPVGEEETLVSLPTSFAAASAFGQLSAAVAMPASGRTLEDLVRELLRPLLKEWLDQHLSGIVESKVAEEVERIARRVR